MRERCGIVVGAVTAGPFVRTNALLAVATFALALPGCAGWKPMSSSPEYHEPNGLADLIVGVGQALSTHYR